MYDESASKFTFDLINEYTPTLIPVHLKALPYLKLHENISKIGNTKHDDQSITQLQEYNQTVKIKDYIKEIQCSCKWFMMALICDNF